MKKLDCFIIRSFIGPFILTFLITIFVLLLQFIWKYVDEFVGKGIEWYILLELFSYALVNFIPLALPLAILLASIMTFGNLGEFSELTALKSSGISLYRIMYPLFVLVLFISIGAILFSNYILPVANLKFYSLLFDVRSQRPEIMIKPGIFYNGIDNYTIRVSKINKRTKMMYNVLIYDHTNYRGNTILIKADSGKIILSKNKDFLLIDLFNGERYEENTDNYEEWKKHKIHRYYKFKYYNTKILVSGLAFKRTDESLFKDNYRMLNIKQLIKTEDSLTKELIKFKENFKNTIYSSSFLITLAKNKNVRKIKEAQINNILKSFSDNELKKIYYFALNSLRNQQVITEATAEEEISRLNWIVRHKIEFHQKFTLSFACIIFFFIGAPLGAIIRKGGLGLPVVISVILFILYYVISLSGEKFAKELIWPAWLGMWFSSFILFPIGILLTLTSIKDINIFNIDWIYKILIKIK